MNPSNPVGKTLEIIGVVTIVFVVLYWSKIVWVYKNRSTIATASDAATTLQNLGVSL